MGALLALAEFGAEFDRAQVPGEVRAKVVSHMLDSIGILVAGSSQRIVQDLYSALVPAGSATERPDERSMLAAAAIHSLDFDDTHFPSLIHPGAPVVGAMLGSFRPSKRTIDEVVADVAVGYEVAIRLAATIPGGFHARGWHPTAVCGAFGAAAAVGRSNGIDARQLACAFSVVASLAAGSSRTIRTGTSSKLLNAGNAAALGTRAMSLGAVYGVLDEGAIEGRFGFIESFLSGAEPSTIRHPAELLGQEWTLLATRLKKYPCGFGEHPFMVAAQAIRATPAFDAQRIKSVVYGEHPSQIDVASEPIAQKRRPDRGYQAKFSRYHCIGRALVQDSVSARDFTDAAVREPEILNIVDRISYQIDSASLWLRVEMDDGAVIEEPCEPFAGLSTDDARRKFDDNVAGVVDPDHAESLVASLSHGGSGLVMDEVFNIALERMRGSHE